MEFLGRYQQGQTVTLFCQGKDANGVATLPDRPPQAKVFNGTTVVEANEMPILDRYINTGFFQHHLFLGAAYSAGQYRVVYYYRVGSYYGVEEDGFEIVAGGHQDGSILNMYFFRRPQADYIVYETEDGIINKGRNPTVR